MGVRRLALFGLGVSLVFGAMAPAFADDDWRWHERHSRQEWRDHAWWEHERRERAWRDHEWREHAWHERRWREYNNAPSPGYDVDPGYYR